MIGNPVAAASKHRRVGKEELRAIVDLMNFVAIAQVKPRHIARLPTHWRQSPAAMQGVFHRPPRLKIPNAVLFTTPPHGG